MVAGRLLEREAVVPPAEACWRCRWWSAKAALVAAMAACSPSTAASSCSTAALDIAGGQAAARGFERSARAGVLHALTVAVQFAYSVTTTTASPADYDAVSGQERGSCAV